MAKTSKGVILSQASQIKSDYSFALIKATADNKSLVQDASSAELKVNALVEYSKDSQWDPKKLTSLGFPAGCFLIVDLRGQDIHAADLITNLALVRQYGYQAGVIDDLSTLDDIKALKANQIYLINSGKTNDDQDASLNGNEITDGSGKLAVGMSVKWQRDYTNVDVSGDHAGFVGMGQDTLLKGGNAFGYSTNGRDFNAVITPKGLIFRRPDAERMWRLLKPNEIADINSTVGDKVKKEVDSATAEIPAAVSAANSAVSAAESAIAASKVNSDAIVAQSSAVIEAKSAMDSATAEIQQLKANAASDVAQIRADVAQVQNEVDTAKSANSASVDKLKSDIGLAQKDLDNVRDSLTKAQSAVEQNQKLINDSVAKITSDVSATKQDLADVHDSLNKAQAAAEQNQKAIDKSIAQINDSVDATNQDLADVRKDLTKAQSDITANQKAVNDNVAQINSNIEQDRKDIASAQQANADTAKQLDTYSKQATEQGKTIKTIQDKQDGFTATLADVQGNVSQVSDKVDGLSASLKDTQGNVASVKAQADQLSATLTNHGKSIATLTASAKELSSTLEDADGRLSKVEQTAQTNSSTLSDVQGDLSQVKQDATTLTATLKDAQGNISTLQQKADSVSAQLASAQGDIATLQTGVDGVKATLTSHDKSIHTLQADSKSLKDSMVNAQGDISTLQKSATSLDSEMKDHAGRLSKVEQSAATQATTLSDVQGNLTQVKQQADGLVTTLKDAQGDITQIQQKADGTLEQLKSAQGDITSLQTNITGIKATLVSHEGDIHTLQADSRMLKDDMKDAQGNISSLQKSSTKLDSEMSSQDGRLSKVEQTSKEHTSTISDLGKKVDSNGGGVNLLTNTQSFDYNWTWDQIGHSFANDVLTLSDTNNGNSRIYQGLAGYDTTGKTFSLSFNARISADCNNQSVQVKAGPYDATKLISITSKDFQPYKVENWQWTGQSGTFSFYVAGGKIDITNLKLEYGAIATPYSLAPGDLATISQVKQAADGIETTLKSAQGDIDQIKQTAKGTSEQLSNVQGDVTNIQKDVNGLKQTTADNAGNIHTLQSDSKTLKDDMADAKGNISSLQKTSTSLVSEFRDHDGRLSKVEQTATEHTSELADTKGNIDKVTQKANTLQLLLSDAQKNIQNIQFDAKGLHDTLTGQSNQLASLNVTLNNLDSKYSGITGDLQSKQTALSTEQQQTKDMLLRKADKSEVDSVKGTVNQVSAEQKTMADQINQKVSSTEYQTLKDKVNNLQVGGDNLISDGDASAFNATPWGNTNFGKHEFYYNGTKNMFVIATSAKTELTSGSNWFPVKAGQQYTLYFNGFMSYNVSSYDVWLLGKPADKDGSWSDVYQIINGQRLSPSKNCIVTKTFTVPNFWNNYVAYVRFDNNGSTDGQDSVFFFNEVSLKEGNINTGYSPSPDDAIASIKKNSTAIDENSKLISLKANQTDVDNIKGTAQQLSARLDVMAGEVKSKVDETRVNNIVDGKGYATTSTVQSLVDQKAGALSDTITELDRKIGDNHSDSIKRIQSLTASIDGLQSRVTNYQNDTSSKYTQLSNLMQSKVGTADFEQLKRSVDMQTLDSADINNMRTNGHYFVRNLANNPVGGWVYVDVTGNGNDRIRQDVYQDSWNKHKFRSWYGDHWTNWEEGATYSEITQLQDAINLRVQKGELLSQINLTAGNTLIQSNKLYLDASSVVITGTAFIPSAAIASLSADKVNTGWLNTNNVNLGDGRTRIIADHDYMYIQPTGSAASNTGIRMGYSGLDFLTNVIPNGYSSSVPYYSVGYDGAANGYFKISAFDHINPGGATATQNWFTMYDAISLNNKEVNIAANNKQRIRVTDKGIEVRPTIFFNNENYSGTWAGFNRLDNSNTVEFNTGDNDGENFHVNSGARFMKYVYFNDYCRAQGWLTYSTLSKKTNIKKLDTSLALDKIRQDDQYLYEYKRNVAKGVYDPQASFIIDDVNDVSHYSVPREFIDQTGKYREPSVELSYLIAAFQEIDKQVQLQKEEIKELKEKLQHE